MSRAAELAFLSIVDLVERVQALDDFGGPLGKKVWHVYSEEELLAYQKGVIFPCAGIIYDGMRNVPSPGEGSPGGGSRSSADLSCTIIALFRGSPQSTVDPKGTTVVTIDRLRSAVQGQRSPTGHFWRFQVEAPVPSKSGVLCYLQRWATAVQLR